MHSCLIRIDDIHKRRLQARAAHQEAIDIRLLRQLVAVLLAHAAAVQDARLVSCLGGHFLLEPAADRGVHFLRLLGGCDFAGADGPGITLVWR